MAVTLLKFSPRYWNVDCHGQRFNISMTCIRGGGSYWKTINAQRVLRSCAELYGKTVAIIKRIEDRLSNHKTLWAFVAGIITLAVYLFVQNKLSPTLRLGLQGTWIDDQRIILRMEIENKSGVRVNLKSVEMQALEYPADTTKRLSEWVPFTTNAVKSNEQPLSWRDPIKIFETTQYVFPGEIVSIERLECLSSTNRLLHVGIQFKSKSGILFIPNRIFGHNERWTRTAIFVPASPQHDLKKS